MKVVLFLVDAFRYDYISKQNTPFLYKLAKENKYIEHIIPSAGFCERTEIFKGLKPNESGFFTAIGYNPFGSPYKESKLIDLLGGIELFLKRKRIRIRNMTLDVVFRKICLKLLRKTLFNKQLKAYNIPFSFLKYFSLTEDEVDILDDNSSELLMNIIQKRGGSFFLEAFTSLGSVSGNTDKDRVLLALSKTNEDYDFIPVYISELDTFGHKEGPDSLEFKERLTRFDTELERTISNFSQLNNDTSFIIIGDHGMSEVKTNINIEEIIVDIETKFEVKRGKDFIFFLDSTIFRMWFLSEDNKEELLNEIMNNTFLLKHGEFIDRELSHKYHIPYKDQRYGDLTWWASEGVLIFPDFFHNSEIVKGMHGYKPDNKNTNGTCIIKSTEPEYVKEMNLHEIYNEIIKLLNN